MVAHARSVAEQAPVSPGRGPHGAGGAAAGPDGGAVLWDTVVDLEDEGDEHVYDLTVPGTHNFVAADVFVHNTSLSRSAWAPAACANRPVLLFSLEMGSLELSQRLLCGEARIDSARVRTGRLSEDDWSRISQAIGRLAAAPIWIDDNPNLTVMEIRPRLAGSRAGAGDLGMVVVDYLQLMTGRSSAENRQVEVSEISRGLKILARAGVPGGGPVPAVPAARAARRQAPDAGRPAESGCLSADARVLRADTGVEVPIGDLAASGERDIPVGRWTPTCAWSPP